MPYNKKGIDIDGFLWPPDDLIERLRSPELPESEFWRSMSYALWCLRDDEKYISALNEVKRERTRYAFPQMVATTPQNELPDAPQRAFGMSPSDYEALCCKAVFHDNLDESQIASELLKVNKMGLGPKQFALAVQEFFLEIGWLVTTVDTHFVGWMKAHQIMTNSGNNLQHVTRNDNMDKLKSNMKNLFQFFNTDSQWEDRNKFYHKDNLGNTLRKINNGCK